MKPISDSDQRVYVALLLDVFFVANLIVMLALPAMLYAVAGEANTTGPLFTLAANLYDLYCYAIMILPFFALIQAAPSGGILQGRL